MLRVAQAFMLQTTATSSINSQQLTKGIWSSGMTSS
jgi:hypothetical protein